MSLLIFGATGAVGQECLSILDKQDIKYKDLILISSKKSKGKKFMIKNKEYTVKEIEIEDFKKSNYCIFCVSSELSKKYIPVAIDNQCRVIDNSSYFRMNPKIPLIVPEINGNQLTQNDLIIANPNCSTILLTMVCFPIHKNNPIKEITVSTYQSASGAGYEGMQELESQIDTYVHNKNNPKQKLEYKTDIFKRHYLLNVFSHNSEINLTTKYNDEETKMIQETKKIMNTEEIDISATCVRVPVMRSHCESVSLTLTKPTSIQEIKSFLLDFSGVCILDDNIYNKFPEPLISSNTDEVYVGRIRKRYGDKTDTRYELFLSGDQLRKGASLNALQIFKLISK